MIKIVDVSHHNGQVDWTKVKASGVEGAIIKASEGVGFVDPRFIENITAAKEAGLLIGAYHFFRPEQDATLQAGAFLKQLHLARFPLLVCLDLEPSTDSNGTDRWNAYTSQECGAMAEAWLDYVQERLKTIPILYTNAFFANDRLRTVSLGYYPLWLARYALVLPDGWKNYLMWQYTEKAIVDGIEYPADMSRYEGNTGTLRNYAAQGFKA